MITVSNYIDIQKKQEVLDERQKERQVNENDANEKNEKKANEKKGKKIAKRKT